jgi:hypothetical protein
MAKDAAVEKAIENGRAHAARILKVRQKALRRRERALKSTAKLAMRGAAAVAAGTLVAEGDSWFDYPFDDVLKELEDGFAYEIESVAHKGDPIEEMAYGGGQLEELTRRLEKLLRHGTVPKAILISGGGNDVVGVEFAMLLNHVDSAIAGLNGKVLDGVVDERVRLAYAHIIASVTDVCEKMTAARVPILSPRCAPFPSSPTFTMWTCARCCRAATTTRIGGTTSFIRPRRASRKSRSGSKTRSSRCPEAYHGLRITPGRAP